MKKITIQKIAEQAGVSRGTVDKVLHGRAGVSDAVRAQVQAIIDAHAYAPRHRARPAPAAAAPQYTIAVLFPRLGNSFFERVRQGMEAARAQCREAEVSVEYFPCEQTDVSGMLSLLSYLEERGVDGIILRGIQSQRLRDRLNHLHEAGIPVALIDADVPGAQRLCMVGEDSQASGRVAASLLARSIGGAGEVAIVGGLPDMPNHRARLQGFAAAVRERFPRIRVVETIYSLDQSVIAYQKTQWLVEQYPNLRGIFSVVGCTGDIGQALIDRQAYGVKVVSYNFTPDIVALVKRGIVDFTMGLTPYRQGETVMRLLLEALLYGRRPDKPFVEMPLVIGVDENIDALAGNQML